MAALAGQSTAEHKLFLGMRSRLDVESPESMEIVRTAPIGLAAPLFKPVTMPPLCYYWLHLGVSFVALSVYPSADLLINVRRGCYGLSRAKSRYLPR